MRASALFFLISSALLLAKGPLQATPDVTFWSVQQTGITAHLRGIAYGAERFVAVGDHGVILASSTNGWRQVDSASANNLTGVTWGSTNFVAIGGGGTILSSGDGISWVPRDSGINQTIRCVTFGNDTFLALATSNSLISNDGVSWSKFSVPVAHAESVCYGNGRFVAVGGDSIFTPGGEICESIDGQTWRVWPQGQAVYHDVVFANGYFTAVGEGLGTHYLLQPLLWRAPGIVQQGGPEVLADTNVQTHRGLAYGDGMFVSVGGTLAPVWIGKISTSPTGANPWTSLDQPVEPWPQTYFGLDNLLLDVAFGAGKFVTVGENGAVVESGAAARFDPRHIRVRADGPIEFEVVSPAGSRLQIEFSTDLLTWSNLLTVTNAAGTVSVPVGAGSRAGFLRATLLP